MADDQILLPYISSTVNIGSVPVGGYNPIRIQSMTNTDTLDTDSSVAQCIRIIEAGSDYVRLTAQGVKEAENLSIIKKELRKAGFDTPLIADIHFNPAAAETAARIVEKVRINPGNYVDKRASFIKSELSDKEYNDELERIHSRLLPLINICKSNNTVVRIGINHGSLSDRIMTRFGNTTYGMVTSAMEFISIFRAENFNDLVLSMKSSDTSVMIESTRMLVRAMQSEGMSYPLHLGVTEAGEGEDGRVRSAAGIGALLSEGIGDTIRVSLSEEPEMEILVAKLLASYFSKDIVKSKSKGPTQFKSPLEKPSVLKNVKGPLVMANMTFYSEMDADAYRAAGFKEDPRTGEIKADDGSADFIILAKYPEKIPDNVPIILPYKIWYENSHDKSVFPLFSPEAFIKNIYKSDKLNILLTGAHFNIELLKNTNPSDTIIIFTFHPDKERFAADIFLSTLEKNNLTCHIILNPVFDESELDNLCVKASAVLGKYIIDEQVSGISISNKGDIDFKNLNFLAFSILQCTGKRITRTQYLSCPTCGRTKFNLQEAVQKVKIVTQHLKGIKIAVMGCVVNGPGEMAGADYGYVGAGAGKVHIYKGTNPVLKNVPEKDATDELIKFIEMDQANL